MNKHVLYVVLGVLAAFTSQTQFKSLTFDLPTDADHIEVFFTLIKNYKLYLGIALYALSSVFWLLGIKGLSLTKAYSMLSLNYILILLYGHYQLGETVTITRVIAVMMIIGGVVIMNSDKKNATA